MKTKIVIKSGVNISLANKLVRHIQIYEMSKKRILAHSGFGSLFDIINYKIKDPVIVSCRWCGTKIDLANKFKKFDTIGIDFCNVC